MTGRQITLKTAAGMATAMLAAPAIADEATAGLATNPALGASELVSFGLSMLVVIVAIIALGWLYSRFRFVGNSNNQVINIVASRALGPKERLLVVEVANRQLLVGMTGAHVQTLHVFDEPVDTGRQTGASAGFGSRLRAAVLEAAK